MKTSGERILSRNGRCICSPRDPQREAADWVQRQKIHSTDKTAVVLGGGAGFHLLELRKEYPNLVLKVIELDPETLKSTQVWLSEMNSDIQLTDAEGAKAFGFKDYDIVLNFRPAWAGQENQYMSEYFRLTQNSTSSLSLAAESNGLPLTHQSLNNKLSNINFTLKELDFVNSDGGSDEVKFWKTLRELIE